MRIQDHIRTISWSMLDKALFLLYGLIFILMINYTTPQEYGLYQLLIAFHTWIFTISDSFALQSLIQFGMNTENRKKVNLVSLCNHLILTLGSVFILYLFKEQFYSLFGKSQFSEVITYLPLLTLAFIPRAFGQKLIYRDQKMFFLFLSNLVFFGMNTIYIIFIINFYHILVFKDLILSYIFASFSSSLITLFIVRKELIFGIEGRIKFKEIFHFNWKMTTGSLLYAIPRQLDTIILSVFFNLNTIGIYSAAKTLFRVFDEAMNAITALIYPSAVRHFNYDRIGELKSIMSKTFSFGFFVFFSIFIIFITFGSNTLFDLSIIPQKFKLAKEFFNIMLISIPFLPFTAIYLVNIASNRMKEYFIIVSTSVVLFFIIVLIVGFNKLDNYLPLALTSYFALLGLTGFFYSKKLIGLEFSSVLRIFRDIKNFLQNKNSNN